MATCFTELCHAGPQFGYYPMQIKSWAIYAQASDLELKHIFTAAQLQMEWL